MKFNRRTWLCAAAAAAPLVPALARAQSGAGEIKLPKPVRAGLIGLHGHYGEALAAQRVSPQIEIAAVSMDSPRERERFEGEPALQGARTYENHQALLEREDLDAAVVAGENGERARQVIACLERGLPVAAEKPLALSMEELEEIRRVVERTGTPLTMLLPMRFDPPYLAMRRIISQGRIGEPIALAGQKSYQLGERPEWMKRRESFGGTIPWIGIHLVDLMRFVSGREMTRVAAFHSNAGSPQAGEMEDNAGALYELDNGGHATLRLDYLRPAAAPTHGDDQLRVAGTNGVVEYQAGKLTLVTDSEPPHEVSDWPQGPPLFADFLDAVFNGGRHALSIEDVFRSTEIVLRSREAAETGKVVSL